MEQRNITRPKRRLNKKRFFGTILVAGLVATGIGKGIGKISEKISHKDSIYYNQDLVDKNTVFNYNSTFDNFSADEYIFSEDINLLIDNTETRKCSIFNNITSKS